MSLRSFKTIPGSGAFAGVLWIAFAAILAPASIYSAFYFCKSTELTSAQALGYLGGGAILPAVIFIFGVSRLADTLQDCLICEKHPLLTKILAWTGAVLFPIAGSFLLKKLIAQKHFFLAAAALFSSLCGVFYLIIPSSFVSIGKLIITVNFWSLAVEFAGFFCLVLLSVVLGMMQKEKRSAAIFLPALGIFLVVSGLIAYNFKLENDIKKLKSEIPLPNEQLKNPAVISAFKGPVKQMWLSAPYSENIEYMQITQQKAIQNLQKFEKENSYFINSLNKLLQMEPGYIRLDWSLYNTLRPMKLNLQNAFFAAIEYLSLKTQANPTDKKLVYSVNEQMKQLIKWKLNLELPDNKESSWGLECIRLYTLSKLLPFKEWSGAELRQLVGENQIQHDAMINTWYARTVFLEKCWWDFHCVFVPAFFENIRLNNAVAWLKFRAFLYSRTYYKFNVRLYAKNIVRFSKIPPIEVIAPVQPVLDEVRKNISIPAACLNIIAVSNLKTTERFLFARLVLSDNKNLLLQAIDIIDFLKKHARLPDGAADFPQWPRSYYNNLPAQYKKSTDSFRLYFLNIHGRDVPTPMTSLSVPVNKFLR